MECLFKTTCESEATAFEREAQKKYGGMAVYRFQYKANDGKFYYEILLNRTWLD